MTITRGSALWAPYRHLGRGGFSIPSLQIGKTRPFTPPSPRLRSGQRGTGQAKNRPRSPVPTSCSTLTTLGQRIHFVSQRVILTIYGNSMVSSAPQAATLPPAFASSPVERAPTQLLTYTTAGPPQIPASPLPPQRTPELLQAREMEPKVPSGRASVRLVIRVTQPGPGSSAEPRQRGRVT